MGASMWFGRPFLIALLLLSGSRVASADVIELRSGERIEGAVKQATETKVTVEVGGQTITFERTRVRTIYFGGAPPTGATPSPVQEALRAVKAVQSVTRGGVSLGDYGPRVTDARIKVDQYLADKPKPPIAEAQAIIRAIELYSLAKNAWASAIAAGTMTQAIVMLTPEGAKLLDSCPLFVAYVDQIRERLQIPPRRGEPSGGVVSIYGRQSDGSVIIDGLAIIWLCASEAIAEAERLLL